MKTRLSTPWLWFFGVVAMLALVPAAGAQITLDTPVPAGSGVTVSGTGAPADGPVELFVNDVSRGYVVADAGGAFNFTSVPLTPGDRVRAQASIVWNFDNDGDLEGWTTTGNGLPGAGNPNTALSVTGGNLVVDIVGAVSDPYFTINMQGLPGGGLDGSVYRVLEMRVRNASDYNQVQFFFASSTGNPGQPLNTTQGNAWKSGMVDFQTYHFGMDYFKGAASNWTGDGPIKLLRIDPTGGTAGTGQLLIDWIRINESVTFEFTDDGDFAYIASNPADGNNITNLSVTGGAHNIEATGGDTWTRFGDGFNWQINMDYFTNLRVVGTFDAATTVNSAELFWTDASGGWGTVTGNRAGVAITADGNPTSYNLDMANFAGASWTGAENPANFNALRFDWLAGSTAGDTGSFDWIRLGPANPFGPTADAVVQLDPTPQFIGAPYNLGGFLVGSAVSKSFVEGIDFEDPNGDPTTLTVLSHSGPGSGAWLSFGSGATSKTLSGTAQDLGAHRWTLQITDGVNASTTSLNLNVTTDTVVVVVDDAPGNDAPYVNGVGGNLTGATALKDAVNAINADPSPGVTSWAIRIVDTDGTSDTYTGDFTVTRAGLDISQAPNGSGNDVAATIVSDQTQGSGVIVVNGAGVRLAGLSDEQKLAVQLNAAGNPAWGLNANATATSVTWQNIAVTGGGDGRFAHNGNAPNMRFLSCDFLTTGQGVQVIADSYFDDCTFNSTGFPLVVIGDSSALVENSSFGSANLIHLAGVRVATFNDCTFSAGSRLIDETQLADGATINFNNPVFTGLRGDIVFNTAARVVTLNISGTPENKANLWNTASAITGRSRAGTITLTDCLTNLPWDTAGGVPVTGDGVTFNLNRCIVTAGAYGAGADVSSDAPIRINATNTIFDSGSNSTGAMLHTSNGTTGSVINLEHCTFFGSPTAETRQMLAVSQIDRRVIANYCIFDAADYSAVSLGAEAAGTTNIINPGDTASGGFTLQPGNPPNTIAGDPLLAVDGRLQPGVSDLAIDAAIGSTQAIDIDGDARPDGDVPDIGADEAIVPNAVRDWGLFE